MKLHHSFGMNPRIVRMFLAEKGIDVPRVEVDLFAGENRSPEYIERNPAGQMPILELDDGTYLAETAAICEYLEELNPGTPLIGADSRDRAETRMWLRRVEIGICQPMVLGFYYAEGYDLFKDCVPCSPEAAPGLKARAQTSLRWLEGLLPDAGYICGDRFSLADIALFTYLDLLTPTGQAIPSDCPKLLAWFARIGERPSAERSLWPVQPNGMRG